MNEQRKVLQLLREGKVTVTKAESLLKQLQENKPIEKQLSILVVGSDGERASFNIPLSVLSLLKGNLVSLDSIHAIKDILKEINLERLIHEIERKVAGEVANIKTARGDQLIINIK